MKQKIESILLEIIKEYLNENKENLFKYPNSTLDAVNGVIQSFRFKCAIGQLGVCDENN